MKQNTFYHTSFRLKAFSLIEILVVLAMIGIILSIAIPRIGKSREITNEIACKAELTSLSSALELYFTKYKEYPERLDILIDKGFLSSEAQIDPWGNPYAYRAFYTGKKYKKYQLSSVGPDGILNTDDDVYYNE